MSNHTTPNTIVLNHMGSAGYAADQVADQSITLADLAEALTEAIEKHGADARIALYDAQNTYGASWGYISQWHNIFEVVGAADDDEEPAYDY